MGPEFSLRKERPRAVPATPLDALQWSRSLHSGWNGWKHPSLRLSLALQWSRSLHSGWNPGTIPQWKGIPVLQWSRSLHSGWNQAAT